MKAEYKLLTYAYQDAGPRAGILVGQKVFDIAKELELQLVGETPSVLDLSVLDILRKWDAYAPLLASLASQATGDGQASERGLDLDQVELLAPIQFPGTVFGAGANFSDHVEEMRRAFNLPEEPSPRENGGQPWFFVKSPTASVVTGPGTEIKLPAYATSVDYEAELAVVIGRAARNVPVEEALDYVAGYTIANDLSARDAVRRANVPKQSPFHFDWVSHKCFDGSCPIGPWITPAEFVGDPQALGIKLWLNGEIRQDGSTRPMIFTVAEQIAFLSSRATLQPGDVILTGTPAGVGTPRGEFLKAGDHVRIWIESIGEFHNSFA